MSAEVSFHTLNYDLLTTEEIRAGTKPCRFSFKCPRHATNRCEGLLLVGADLGNGQYARRVPGQNKPAMWDWDGNIEAPTLSPSIDCRTKTDTGAPAAGCGWHGYIKKGEISGA